MRKVCIHYSNIISGGRMKRGFLQKRVAPPLPKDLIQYVASYLDEKNKGKMAVICKDWHRAISIENPERAAHIKLKKDKYLLKQTEDKIIDVVASFFSLTAKVSGYMTMAQMFSPPVAFTYAVVEYCLPKVFTLIEQNFVATEKTAVNLPVEEKNENATAQLIAAEMNISNRFKFTLFKPENMRLQDDSRPVPYHAYAIVPYKTPGMYK